MNTKHLFRSFAGGEITPELYGRLDLAKHQTGLAECRNFWTLPHGPAQNRSGFEYVNEVKDSTKKTRIIPFQYSTEQAFILEVSDQAFRWHTLGATLLEASLVPTGISVASPAVWTSVAHGFTVGQWLFVNGITGTFGVRVNGRFLKVGTTPTADTFTLTDLGDVAISSTGFTITGFGTVARVYTLAHPYLEADLFKLHYTQSADVMSIVHTGYAPRELKRLGATNWTITSISFVPSIAAPTTPTGATGGPGGGTPIDHFYKTTALATDTLEESLGSTASAAVNRDLAVSGNFIDVDPTPGGAVVAGAVRYNIYKLFNGLYGLIGQTDGSTFRDNNVSPDVSRTPPEASVPFATDFPAAVGYYESRRGFAGTTLKPQNWWLTRSATESNLSYSIPQRDDDAIAQRIVSSQVNRIRHMVPITDLLLLTSGGPWKISPQNSDVLTPSSASPKKISNAGASEISPVITDEALLYASALGTRINEIRYEIQQNSAALIYKVRNVSLLAPHIFKRYAPVDMAFTSEPTPILWVVRADGKLIGLTYLPEHEVVAWHTHDTDGEFESVAVIAEGNEDVLYAVIKRTLGGRTVRTIERLRSRVFAEQEDAFFVDCGDTYEGAATDEITGLWHLEGEEVAILADGGEHPNRTVVDGTVQLERESTIVHIGLPITAYIKTLPLVAEAQALGQGLKKNVNEVWLRVQESTGIFAGPSLDKLREYAPRTSEPYDSPPELTSDEVNLKVDNKWGSSGQVYVQQTKPLPLTIVSMAVGVALGG